MDEYRQVEWETPFTYTSLWCFLAFVISQPVCKFLKLPLTLKECVKTGKRLAVRQKGRSSEENGKSLLKSILSREKKARYLAEEMTQLLRMVSETGKPGSACLSSRMEEGHRYVRVGKRPSVGVNNLLAIKGQRHKLGCDWTNLEKSLKFLYHQAAKNKNAEGLILVLISKLEVYFVSMGRRYVPRVEFTTGHSN